ncbi:MAG: hypothetical protein LBL83_08540, partial [Clostridiales bacterium]|nr:hypothetical protein [Clostridiales bacterium]
MDSRLAEDILLRHGRLRAAMRQLPCAGAGAGWAMPGVGAGAGATGNAGGAGSAAAAGGAGSAAATGAADGGATGGDSTAGAGAASGDAAASAGAASGDATTCAGADALLIACASDMIYVTGRVINGYFYLPADGGEAPVLFVKKPVGLGAETFNSTIEVEYASKPELIPGILARKGRALPRRLLFEDDQVTCAEG